MDVSLVYQLVIGLAGAITAVFGAWGAVLAFRHSRASLSQRPDPPPAPAPPADPPAPVPKDQSVTPGVGGQAWDGSPRPVPPAFPPHRTGGGGPTWYQRHGGLVPNQWDGTAVDSPPRGAPQAAGAALNSARADHWWRDRQTSSAQTVSGPPGNTDGRP